MNSSLDLVHLAARAAERAGEYIRSATRGAGPPDRRKGARPGVSPGVRPADWIEKGPHDWVTDVDRTAERLISEVLRDGTRGTKIVGEEFSPELASDGLVWDGLVWIVDPLDGTSNFLHGYPQYSVSICAAIDGVLEAGVVLDITRECCYGAARGKGAWLGGTRLCVSEIHDPGRSLLGTGYPFKDLEGLDSYLAHFRELLRTTSGVRRAGSAALDLADVASGRFDGFWELRLAPWDIAAGVLLIREAGGVVTDMSGREVGLEHTSIVAGNPFIHAWLLRTLRDL